MSDCELCGSETNVKEINIDGDNLEACEDCRTEIFSPSEKYKYFTRKIDSTVEETVENLTKLFNSVDAPFVDLDEVYAYLDEDPSVAKGKLDYIRERVDNFQSEVIEEETEVWYTKEEPESKDGTVQTILFPERREIIVNEPDEETRQRLSRFAHLVDDHGDAFMYKIDSADIWNTPHDSLDDLLEDIRAVTPEPSPHMEDRIESDWEDAHKFVLLTSSEGFSRLRASNPEDIDNIAKRHLDYPSHYTKRASDTDLRLKKGSEGEVKQILYKKGYPVQDRRELDSGEPLNIELDKGIELRDYQSEWVERFVERGAGTFVGPSGSGKTVAALGVMSEIDGEVLVIVTRREVATQWAREIVNKTNIPESSVGEYHGGKKDIKPITIATYDIAQMSQHRELFNKREWGLLVYDECHHVPAPVWKRTTNLQSRYRLGLTATPVRESGQDKEIYSLIGPPVGTDWAKLFKQGHVQEPEVQIRYVPWASEKHRERYNRASGTSKQQVAASNPRKLEEVKFLLDKYEEKKKLIFVQWIDQGKEYADELDLPFIYGETPHSRRETLFEELRQGERDTLLISSVGDEGIDLPDAEVAIIASWRGSSRSQGAQRPGRVMRPVGDAKAYFIATKGSNEEDFARSQTRYLSQKGVKVTENTEK